MKAPLLFLIPFLFLLFLNIPAFASAPVEINLTYNKAVYTPTAIMVSNLTGTTYVYLLGFTQASAARLERYDANWANMVYCTFAGTANYEAAGLANSTHLLLKMADNNYRLVSIANMATNTTCQASDAFGSNSGYQPAGMGYYGTAAAGYSYVPTGEYGIINSTTADNFIPAFWNSSVRAIKNSNVSQNTTVYGMLSNGKLTRYDNSVDVGGMSTFLETFGIDTFNGVANWDILKYNASTTEAWFIDGTGLGTMYLVRANFSKLESLGSYGVWFGKLVGGGSIENQTTSSSPVNLGVFLETSCNGTIYWYLDGSNIGNTTINTAPFAVQFFYFSSGTLTEGGHSNYAVFNDSCVGANWTAQTNWFTYETPQGSYDYLLKNPANGLALLIGGVFSTANLATSQQISSIIFSVLIAIAIVLGIGMVGKGKMATDSLMSMFGITIMSLLVMFTLIGWFPAWLLILMLVISAYAFVKLGKIGG